MHHDTSQPGDNRSVKTALVDDHIVLREGLAAVINDFTGYKVMIRAGNGSELIEQLRPKNLPDIVLLDLNMPVMNGCDTVQWLKKNYPEVRIVIFTMFDSEPLHLQLLRLGVRGVVKKDVHPNELNYAMDKVMKGEYYCSQFIADEEGSAYAPQLKQPAQPVAFSEKEIEFMKWSVSDLTYKKIADKMHVSEHTVKNYWTSLKEKLGIRSRVALAMYAVEKGIIHI